MKACSLRLSPWAFLFIVSAWRTIAQYPFNNVVQTTSGTVSGTKLYYNGIPLRQYLGVPYAQPPLGDLRFKKPQPFIPRQNTLLADEMPPACIQYIEYPFPWYDFEDGKSEDCLYLNIWAPKLRIRKLPVIFWIYGGGFTVGSNRQQIYAGQALAAVGNVVVVTINYRMAAFGFLNSRTEDAPGNVGMHDMVAALKWVNQNIDAFGGDSSQITLAGQSAGSIAVGLLCVSPITKGLFQRVIMQSGSPAYLFAEDNDANVKESQKLAKALGCADDIKTIQNDPEAVVRCLRDVDAEQIARTLNSFHPTSARSFFPNYGDEILPINSRKALIDGVFHNVNVLIGNNMDEGSFLLTTANPDVFGFFGEKNTIINRSVGENMLKNTFASFQDTDAVIEYYLGDLDQYDYEQVRRNVYTANGDYSLLCPTVYFAESYSKAGNEVHYYYFRQRPSNTPWAKWMGVAHYEEVQFVFGLPLKWRGRYTLAERLLSNKIVKIWSNFAKRGSPESSFIWNWPKYSRQNPTYVNLDTNLSFSTGRGPHKDNCDFFREYFGFQ